MINVIDNDGCHRHGSPSVYLGSIIAKETLRVDVD
jgi:hypothetical protein